MAGESLVRVRDDAPFPLSATNRSLAPCRFQGGYLGFLDEWYWPGGLAALRSLSQQIERILVRIQDSAPFNTCIRRLGIRVYR